LDGMGNEGSGWVILYMHIESRDRVQPGTFLHAGDRVGHPFLRRRASKPAPTCTWRVKFNGEWISAWVWSRFNLKRWISSGTGEKYVGTLTRQRRGCPKF